MADLNGSTFGFIMKEIMDERCNQEKKKKSGKFKYTLSDPECTALVASTCIQEEVGEVARGILVLEGLATDDSSLEDLEDEIIQVCALGVAFLERLRNNPVTHPNEKI